MERVRVSCLQLEAMHSYRCLGINLHQLHGNILVLYCHVTSSGTTISAVELQPGEYTEAGALCSVIKSSSWHYVQALLPADDALLSLKRHMKAQLANREGRWPEPTEALAAGSQVSDEATTAHRGRAMLYAMLTLLNCRLGTGPVSEEASWMKAGGSGCLYVGEKARGGWREPGRCWTGTGSAAPG